MIWRLTHSLFGWHWVQVSVKGTTYKRIVRKRAEGVYIVFKGERCYLSPYGHFYYSTGEYRPLTFKLYGELVEDDT